MSAGELACTYAALVLHDDGITVTAETIATLVKAANLTVESYWPSLFAKLCEKKNIEDLIMNVGAGDGSAAVAVAAPDGGSAGTAAPAARPAEEKKIIVDFTASWCGPCRFIAPFFAEPSKKLPDVTFLKVDVDELKVN